MESGDYAYHLHLLRLSLHPDFATGVMQGAISGHAPYIYIGHCYLKRESNGGVGGDQAITAMGRCLRPLGTESLVSSIEWLVVVLDGLSAWYLEIRSSAWCLVIRSSRGVVGVHCEVGGTFNGDERVLTNQSEVRVGARPRQPE